LFSWVFKIKIFYILGEKAHLGEKVHLGEKSPCRIIVEIDETKLGKRKYHRGHWVEGVWVIAGVERTGEKRFFAVEVADRTAETIKEILDEYILPGSIIYTDCWKSYNVACEIF
jgi:hypothetical protein